MAKDSFKVKKSLNIKPTDPSTLTNREAGDIIVDSTDNNKLKTYNPSSDTYQSVSTPGGLDTVFVENLESNTSSSFTTGQNAAPDAAGTGTLGGAVSDETSSQISGERSLKYTMNATAASSNNDFFLNDTDIVLDAKHKGNFIGISFYYTYDGADNDIRFFVLDQDDNEITQSDEYIKANTNPTRFSTSVFVPSDDTALRYGFQVVSGNSSKVFIVDDIEFSTNPFVYKNLASENVYSARIANNGTATVTSTSADWIDSVSRSSAGKVLVTFKPGFFTEVPSVNFIAVQGGYSTINVGGVTTSGFTAFIRTDAGTGLDRDFHVMVQRQGADYQAPAEHVVTPAKSNYEEFRADTVAGLSSSNTNVPYFTNERVNTISALGTVTNDSTNGFTFTAKKKVLVISDASYNVSTTATGGAAFVKNATAAEMDTSPFGTSAMERAVGSAFPNSSDDYNSFTGITYLEKNETLTVINHTTTSPRTGNVDDIIRLVVIDIEGQILAAVPMNYTQTKVLSTGTATAGTLTDLTFNNLVVGKIYRVDLQASLDSSGGADNAGIKINHNGSTIGKVFDDSTNGTGVSEQIAGTSVTFTATATTLTFDFYKVGTGAVNATDTFATLTELNYTKETTRFT